MKYTMEFIPEAGWEPDTDKWRLFPESKLCQAWYDEFVESSPLNEVRKYPDTGDYVYSVMFESNNDKDAFCKGHDIITNYIQEENMVKRIITCDRCGGNIELDENYLVLDGYWTKADGFLEEMQFHPDCWDIALRELKEEKEKCEELRNEHPTSN